MFFKNFIRGGKDKYYNLFIKLSIGCAPSHLSEHGLLLQHCHQLIRQLQIVEYILHIVIIFKCIDQL